MNPLRDILECEGHSYNELKESRELVTVRCDPARKVLVTKDQKTIKTIEKSDVIRKCAESSQHSERTLNVLQRLQRLQRRQALALVLALDSVSDSDSGRRK